MAEQIPLYGDETLLRVARLESSDTIPRSNMATGTLFDNAAGVPFTPTQGIEATDTQTAIGEVTSRYAGGRRVAYIPYTIDRRWDRIQRVHRTGSWIAGDADLTDMTRTHGTNGHLYPFMTFAAVDSNGHPHMDHDRLATAAGPNLVTTSEGVAIDKTGAAAGLCNITKTGTDWNGAPNYGPAEDYVVLMDWSNSVNNGYRIIDSLSGTTMVVRDPGNTMVDEATGTGEVRGTSTNTSGFNGYEEGIFISAGTLFNSEERIQLRCEGFLENNLNSDAFVEFVVEPNPVAGTYAGSNRVRMLSGQLGATWTGVKWFLWMCTFSMGNAESGDEYNMSWTMDIEDVADVEGYERITGGQDFKTEDVFLSTRFRVDRIANIDTYDATYQGATNQGASTRLRLETHKFDAEPIH